MTNRLKIAQTYAALGNKEAATLWARKAHATPVRAGEDADALAQLAAVATSLRISL